MPPLFEMSNFVVYDIINERLRDESHIPIDGQISSPTATAPFARHSPEEHPADRDTQLAAGSANLREHDRAKLILRPCHNEPFPVGFSHRLPDPLLPLIYPVSVPLYDLPYTPLVIPGDDDL